MFYIRKANGRRFKHLGETVKHIILIDLTTNIEHHVGKERFKYCFEKEL